MEAKASATSVKKKRARARAKVAHGVGKKGGRALQPGTPPGAVPAERLAISFAATLAADVREAAKLQTDGNVSAWLAEAARERLRQMYVDTALEMYEAKHGVITEAELAKVRTKWPR
jgi:hypothetical protein